MQNLKSIKRDNSKKENFKKHSGITLIALVITIIVLLILAGVALATLTGDSGILNNAENAKENTTLANIREQVQLAVQSSLIHSLGSEIEEGNFQKELDNVFGEGVASLSYDETEKMYTVTVKGYEVIVTNKGNVESIQKAGETNENISIKLTLSHSNTTLNADTLPNVSEVTSENVPIPEGFYRVGGTKDTGVVISDVQGDDLNNTKQGNQFVWVPVNQNQKLTLEVTTKEEITGITLVGPDGTETEVTPSKTTSHSQEITMTKNGVYVVKVETANEMKTAQKRVMSLYAQDIEMGVLRDLYYKQNNEVDYNNLDELITDKIGEGKTEQDFLDYIKDEYGYNSLSEYFGNEYIYVMGYEEEFKAGDRGYWSTYTDNNQNVESVNKYGGFYIARFEAGDGTTDEARTSSSLDTNTLVSQKGEYIYNYVDWETAKTLSIGMYSASSYVTSQVITGAGWDRTLNWLIETGMEEEKVLCDSRSWGNYANSTGNALTNSGSSNMNFTTGRSEYWKANNIYDLAGNTWEWTQETSGTGSIYRGGVFNYYGGFYPASNRLFEAPALQLNDISFRTQLCIK